MNPGDSRKDGTCSGSSVVTDSGVANRCEWLGRAPIPNDGGRRFESGPEHRVMLPPDVRALQFGEIWTADANRNVAWKSLGTKCGDKMTPGSRQATAFF